MASAIWRFSTTRMLHDYVEKMYLPAAEAGRGAAKPATRKAPRRKSTEPATIAAGRGA